MRRSSNLAHRGLRGVLEWTLVAGLGLLGLGLLDVASSRVRTFEGPHNPLRGGAITRFGRHDPLLFWSLRPNVRSRDGKLSTNRLGLRGPEVPLRKAPGEVRILCLGESTTLARTLPYDESYPARLDRALNRDGRGSAVRVINAGVTGYSIFQGYQYLKHRGLALDPDVVVIYFGVNDLLPVTFLAERAGGEPGQALGRNDRELFEERRSPLGRLRGFLVEHSNLYRGLLHWRGLNRVPDGATVWNETVRRRVPDPDRERVLTQLLELSRERDIELVIAIPWYLEFVKHIPLLRAFAEAEGVPVVDLPARLDASLDRPRAEYFRDTVHPTAEGHALIAGAIYDVLVELGL